MVLGVVLVPLTRVKFEPVTVPCVCTDAAPGGVFTVASYLMVTLLPTFSTTGRLNETVSPENGVTGFEADAIEFALLLLALRVGALFSEGDALIVVASPLRRKFNFVAKAAIGGRTCFSHVNVVGEALLPPPSIKVVFLA